MFFDICEEWRLSARLVDFNIDLLQQPALLRSCAAQFPVQMQWKEHFFYIERRSFVFKVLLCSVPGTGLWKLDIMLICAVTSSEISS